MGEISNLKLKKGGYNADAWMNIMTGLQTTRDKGTYSEIANWTPLTKQTCQAMYATDEAARKCAVLVPTDAVREGISWNMDETEDHETILKYMDEEFRRLDVMEQLREAWIQANVFGGAIALLVVDDGSRKLSSPLKPEKVKEFKSIRIFNRHEVFVEPFDVITDLSSEYYGQPLYYRYTPNLGTDDAKEIKIHHTRVVRFDGNELPRDLYVQNGYWHDTIYKSLHEAIKNYSVVHETIASMVYDFQTPLYKIEGLSEALAQDEDELVVKKVQIAHLTKSINRALVLDAEDQFENISLGVSGISELVDLTIQRLVVGMRVPKTIFLGVSPSGLSGTGYSELINYYDNVKSMQQVKLRKPIELITKLIFEQDGAMARPENLVFSFNPLFQLDREAEQKARKLQADIDSIYIDKGVVSREEVTQSRFGHGTYNYETVLDETLGERVTAASMSPMAMQSEEATEGTKEQSVSPNELSQSKN